MRILYYINTMQGGGAARLLSLLANELNRRGHEVLVATNVHHDILFLLDNNIKVISLYPKDAYSINRVKRMLLLIQRSRQIAKEIKPDVIVSFLPPVSFFVRIAIVKLHIPIIFCDNTSYARKDSMFVHFVRYHFYNLANAVTILTENDRKILGNRLPNKIVINNPLSYHIYSGAESREKIVLAIGHTIEWDIKGFDILIESFGKLSMQFPDWKLYIAGSTSEESLRKLDAIIQKYSMGSQVQFIGFQKNINELMQKASIYALSSRIEGFSLSLTEAISQGCACISFKIHGVISDVTENGHGTILIDDGDVATFTCKLSELMSDEVLRKRLSIEGRAYIKKYSLSNIVDQWDNLLNKVRSQI